ncbi:MAG: c-type cytochrome biogenesis protein CcsB [Silvimonas sp.]|nr:MULTISPECIES: c-type cytochrome biogenesis protein CcsB [Silvimonas]MDR3427651.1 c-type cytochrome biogenesis protein CcsB [Silvimonas sp.]
MIAAGGIAYARYGQYMDYYEHGILLGATIGIVWFGWFWPAMRYFLPAAAVLALIGTASYHGDLATAQHSFLLKYFLASQSAVMWMCVLYVIATVLYWVGMLSRSGTALSIASGLTWTAALAALTAMLVRWYESYLIGSDVGHIPVSNLYEVFILFCLITTLMYLYYEARFKARAMGAFVLLVITAAVGFILWYSLDRGAHEIQPLIPALQSWWMKIHVPANFIGYGAFALSAMLGVAQLLVSKGVLASRLPSYETLGEVMYKAVSVGFLFFTIATILGAAWAADAWGGYWSWDPKETWALIVWLNYAAWLHVRLVKGWRGNVLAWWSVIGLVVTTFAFLGVNMFLSGLHSYGGL